jgi:hypothetical protein
MDMKKLVLIALLFIVIPLSAYAVKVTSLYHADMPVSSQSDDERAQAVKQGFTQLLIKLTGNPDIANNPDIKEAIKRADYYVQEYSYSAPTTNSATYLIHLTFEMNDINRLLKKSGIAVWGEKRPLILVWLAVTDAKHVTEIVGNETPGDVIDLMKYQGKKLALPLIFPLMDVTDMSQVSPEEVAAMTLPVLKQAGKRYSPNAYLIGKIEPTDNGYQSEWQLLLNQDEWSWNITDKTMDAVIKEVLMQASQALSKYYQVKS